MSVKISRKIASYEVVKPEELEQLAAEAAAQEEAEKLAEVVHLHERVERPEILAGTTYKIRSPLFEHALYVTINDIILNEGTEHETHRPFEIFINSKNMEHFQWAVALTRLMSAVFRKGGDVTFIVEELKAVFDPRGGYYKSGGIYMPSVVAELGLVVEDHMKRIGLIRSDDPAEREALRKKKQALKDAQKAKSETESSAEKAKDAGESADTFPPNAELCHKCHTKAMMVLDGCQTCLSCGYSKCG
ncbi:MAG: NrdJb [Xanthomonadales bacterium]|nr:NrdJb [Xanthomonadales bacterium]